MSPPSLQTVHLVPRVANHASNQRGGGIGLTIELTNGEITLTNIFLYLDYLRVESGERERERDTERESELVSE